MATELESSSAKISINKLNYKLVCFNQIRIFNVLNYQIIWYIMYNCIEVWNVT